MKRFREKDFRETLDYIYKADPKDRDSNKDKDVRRVLNHLEYIATLYYDDTLKREHVEHMFGGTLKTVKNSTLAMEIMEEQRKENPKFYYKMITRIFGEDWI